MVERDPAGFAAAEQEAIVRRAIDVTGQDGEGDEIRFALPILNTEEVFPGSEEDGTTAVTHLFFDPGVSLTSKVDLADAYAEPARESHFAGVTGPGPARLAQFEEIEEALPWVELGTVLAIALVVGLTFRSLGAPLLTLAASAIAFLVAGGLIPWVAKQLDATIPQEVEPLVVALTLGIVTDYTIFFLSACRRELAGGASRLDAARRSCTAVAPIVATAGLIVVAGTGALVVGELEFFRAFGPALALTSAVSLGRLASRSSPPRSRCFGRLVFWPSLTPREEEPELVDQQVSRLARTLTSRPAAAVVALLTVAALAAAATGIRHTELALRLGSGLPESSEVQQAAVAADQGFAAGVLAPTTVLVEGEGVAARTDELAPPRGRARAGTGRRGSHRAAGAAGRRAGRRLRRGERKRRQDRGHRRRATARLGGDQGPPRARASGSPTLLVDAGLTGAKGRSPGRRRWPPTRLPRSSTARRSWAPSCSP